ncbi:cupin domain-containing protein [Pokkaliibacter sp. CJK22405]|uniref:cupin domain-containing protein n=1 Tax=Pokkaliibacter sp. CJK22405 TaxID=3384615 RepID=UPI003984C14E
MSTVTTPLSTNEKINLAEKLACFDSLWTPHIVGTSNGQLIKIAKGEGELVWHAHENEDELFMVISGQLTLQFRDKDVVLNPGEMYIVPKGVEHCPKAIPGTAIMLIEPASTAHTGTTESDQTVSYENQRWI